MNINLILTKIKSSDLDDGMKQSLTLILDKALGDADIVARLEDEIRDLEYGLTKAGLPSQSNPFVKILKRIRDG